MESSREKRGESPEQAQTGADLDELFKQLRRHASRKDSDLKYPPSEVGNPGDTDPHDIQESQREPSSDTVCGRAATDASPPSSAPGHIPYEQPLAKYVWWALQRAEQEKLSSTAKWVTPLFHFIRWVRDHPEVRSLDAAEAMDKIERALETKTPKGRCPWEAWFEVERDVYEMNRDTAEAEFFGVWERIRYRPGNVPLTAALERARECPLQLSEDIARKRPSGYARFVSLAGWLQVQMGNRAIFLPVAETAQLLGVDPSCISRYRRWATEDGYLHVMKAAERPREGRKGEATEFRFDVRRFPVLGERAQRDNRES